MELTFHFKVERVKRVTYEIPSWADDTCVTNYGTPDGKYKISYYHGCDNSYINLPDCKRAEEVYLTPMRNKQGRIRHRIIVIDLFY